MNALSRRQLCKAGLAALGLGWAGSALRPALAWQEDPELSAEEMVTPQAQAAIDKGLAFLHDRQNDEGSFGTSGYANNVAVCSLAGLAFMCSGSPPGRGPYGDATEKCLGFVMSHVEDSGFITVTGSTSHGPMYEHGFATLFLAECYGMTARLDLRDRLSKAVDLIVQTQNTDGGWRYQPRRHEADISVTVCQIMALRAARNAGLNVPTETVKACIDYVKRSQNPDGGFMYMLTGGQSAFPRSAAGVVALYSAGIYDGPEIERGLKYVFDELPQGSNYHRESHYFYGHYYAVQAMWHAGGKYWAEWYPAIREELCSRQHESGAWMDSICQEYGTAMACIILQMPNNCLPVFQR